MKLASSKPSAVIRVGLASFAAWAIAATFAVADDGANRKRDSDWWSLRPLSQVAVPALNSPWIRTPVDAFILATLRDRHFEPSREADRRTLIRRLTYDLHGLPPTPDESEAFLHDESSTAYDGLVDRLLASPRYGERWARHWLDVVHYGETHGYDKDKPRANAWPYRDYVIRSLNDDKPYDRFVAEQVAGDALYPNDPQAIIATGFIVAGPWDFVGHVELREGTVDKQIARSNDRDDMVANTMSTFASLTVHCARCHDHKFDPIRQEDYYGLQAVFAGVERADRPFTLDPKPAMVFAAAREFAPQGSFTPSAAPRAIHVLARGDVRNPQQLASPSGVPAVQGPSAEFALADSAQESQRRAALAGWFKDPRNALVRRSIVNRVWQYHFGQAIVDTPNDFGRMGSLPTHPELLEWLAGWFIENGHSLKKLHRLLLTSAVYRQASQDHPPYARQDGGNRFLWRMNRQRLDAESIHDAMLSVTGRLNLEMGGSSVQQFFFKDDHSPVYDYTQFDVDDPRGARRSVYRFLVRSVPDPFMECLDSADASVMTPRRNITLTSIQALALLNNPFAVRQAEHFAARLRAQNAAAMSQIQSAYRLALGRPANEREVALLTEYAQEQGLENTCRVLFNCNEFLFID